MDRRSPSSTMTSTPPRCMRPRVPRPYHLTGTGSLIAGGQIFPNWGKNRRPGASFQAVFTVAPRKCRVLAVNHGVGDLNDNQLVLLASRLIDRKGGVGRVAGKIVRTRARLPFIHVGGHRQIARDAHRAVRKVQCLQGLWKGGRFAHLRLVVAVFAARTVVGVAKVVLRDVRGAGFVRGENEVLIEDQ